MAVIRQFKTRMPRHTMRCLEKLLSQAREGKLTGIAFVAYVPGGYIADTCGEAKNDPAQTINMLLHLMDKLL